MGKPGPRWRSEDIRKLKTLAQRYPSASIASELGRSVSALTAKAHELKVSLRVKRDAQVSSATTPDPRAAGFDLSE